MAQRAPNSTAFTASVQWAGSRRFGSVQLGSYTSRFRFRRFWFQIRFHRFRFRPVRSFPPIPTAAISGPKHPGGYFLDPQNSPKTLPKPPKLKTPKTHVNKPFQELSLKPSSSSHRKDAHSRILVPKGPNLAKIKFSGPHVRVKIRLHPVPVPSGSGSIQFHLAPGSTLFLFQIVRLTVLRFGCCTILSH